MEINEQYITYTKVIYTYNINERHIYSQSEAQARKA